AVPMSANPHSESVPVLTELFEHLFEHSPMSVAVLEGSRLVHRWCNDRWAARLPGKQPREALLGKPFDAVLAEGESELRSKADIALQTGQRQVFRDLFVHGATGESYVNGVAIPWHGHVVLQIAPAARQPPPVRPDLGASDFADQVLEQIPHPVVVLNRAGRVLRANNKARTRFGVEIGQ